MGAIVDAFSAGDLREPLLTLDTRIQTARDVAANLLASQLPRAVGTPTDQYMYVRGIGCDEVATKLLELAGFEHAVDHLALDRRRKLDNGLLQISAIALCHVCIWRQNPLAAMYITPWMVGHPAAKGMIREVVTGHVWSLPQLHPGDQYSDIMYTFARLQVDCERKQ